MAWLLVTSVKVCLRGRGRKNGNVMRCNVCGKIKWKK